MIVNDKSLVASFCMFLSVSKAVAVAMAQCTQICVPRIALPSVDAVNFLHAYTLVGPILHKVDMSWLATELKTWQ